MHKACGPGTMQLQVVMDDPRSPNGALNITMWYRSADQAMYARLVAQREAGPLWIPPLYQTVSLAEGVAQGKKHEGRMS